MPFSGVGNLGVVLNSQRAAFSVDFSLPYRVCRIERVRGGHTEDQKGTTVTRRGVTAVVGRERLHHARDTMGTHSWTCVSVGDVAVCTLCVWGLSQEPGWCRALTVELLGVVRDGRYRVH